MDEFCYKLIEKELEKRASIMKCEADKDVSFKKMRISRRIIDRICNHYDCEAVLDLYYDSDCPEPNDPTSMEEIKNEKQRRVQVNNWVDVNTVGNWGISQEWLNRYAKRCLIEVKKYPPSYHDRLYIHNGVDVITIYYFGRDIREVDYIWTFRKRVRRLR